MNFWRTEAGQQHREDLRRLSAARLHVEYEPRGKKAQQQENFFRDLLLADAKIWENTPLGGWPRPKAEVALDISAVSSQRNAPRPDTLCKWLLDQLDGSRGTPVLFADDRQVTMLFARSYRDRNSSPSINVDARRAYLVRESLRRALRDTDDPWSPTSGESNPYAHLLGDDFGDSWLDMCKDRVDLLQMLGEHQDTAADLSRAKLNLRVQTQRVRLALTDTMAGRAIGAHALPPVVPPPGMHGPRIDEARYMIEAFLQMPYSYDLGPMPTGSGSKAAFKDHVRNVLTTAVLRDQNAYPLLNTVGVTVLYVPSKDGKDLDNIFRELLPIMLDVFRPPRTDVELAEDLELWKRVAAGSESFSGDPLRVRVS